MFKSYSQLLAACGGGALLALSCGSAANAQVIYNDTFARTGALLGSSPSPVDSGGAYWQGSAGTMDNTTAQTNGSELTLSSASGYAVASAFLPFTPPTSGTVTLSANIEVAGTSGEWGTIGFVNDSQVGNGMVNAGPAIVVVNSSSVLLEPNGPVGVPTIYTGVPNFNNSTFYHFSIDYNLSTQTVQWYLGSGSSATLLGSYDYASNPGSTPAISQVEVGSQGSSGNEVINFQNFELTSTTPVPEPAALALFAAGGPYVSDPNYLVPPNGLDPGDIGGNSDAVANSPNGFRYRHMSDSPNSGVGNAVFFDGHAASIPINHNVSGAAAGSPGSNGTSGLRILNIINPDFPGQGTNSPYEP